MKVFITGGSGFIGRRLTERLVRENHDVVLLLRNPEKFYDSERSGMVIIKGDISNKELLLKGMQGADMVFHLAAFTAAWSEDPGLPFKVNVTGTGNVLEAAMRSSVKKFVMTSTCGTMGYSESGKPIDETTNSNPRLCTLYESTKAEAERLVIEYSGKGLDAVIVNPSRIYGPGPLTRGNSLTRIMDLYIRGLWRILPGTGKSIGNYVFIDDVVEGHILAGAKGKSGERYILGGENLSFSELFFITGEVAGKQRKMISLSAGIMKNAARTIKVISPVFNVPPLITEEWIDKYTHDAVISSGKAARQLGYAITPFRTGAQKTISWLRSERH